MNSYNGELIFVEPESEKGFHYPYYLFIPDGSDHNQASFLVVEPNNSGFVDDDLKKHIEKAERTATNDFYLGSYVAQNLKYPLLVPVFPRKRSNWEVYTHALDRDVMMQKENSLERIDLQLIEMFEDARQKLKEREILTNDQFLLTGFSASGSFANRFTLIHPDKVFAVAAGGINGLLMFPLDSLRGKNLKFPLGTYDFKELLTHDFQAESFKQTPQFYFMGAKDENDAIPYDDAYNDEEREIIYHLTGKEMLPARWEYSRDIYKTHDIEATLKTYVNTGHEQTEQIKEDVTVFFKTLINQ
jgi:hypothetical protein